MKKKIMVRAPAVLWPMPVLHEMHLQQLCPLVRLRFPPYQIAQRSLNLSGKL
jgi:hypothetical protein